MNITENLLVTAMEEAGELVQDISKILRFGLTCSHITDSTKKTNEQRMLTEYYQLIAVIEMLFERGAVRDMSPEDIKTIKGLKRKKWKSIREYPMDSARSKRNHDQRSAVLLHGSYGSRDVSVAEKSIR